MGKWRGLPSWSAMVLVAVVAMIWLATTSFPILDKSQIVSSAQLQPVSAGHELIQTIRAPKDTISRVDLILGNPYPGAEGELQFQLVEVIGPETGGALRLGETLREVNLDTSSFDYTTRQSFEFESVNVIPGSTYAIRLTSNDSEDTAVRPRGWPVDNYNGGRVYIDGEATTSDLYLGIFHNAGAGEILEKMKPWRPFPLNRSFFIVVLFLTGAATFGWVLWVVAGGQVDGKGENPSEGEGAPPSTILPGATAAGKLPPAGPARP
ncbi:MAG: hypothetical protein JJD96_07240, partial [Thermoleophilia bacterium]|nr:hypothetical protein [Thermoleophilia bacterium]